MADPRLSDSGVTLIEKLVVLMIIGVGAGVVSLALPDGAPPRAVAQETALLQSRLDLAATRSLIAGRHMRLVWDAGGYGVELWDGEGWVPDGDRHQMAGGLGLRDGDGNRRGVLAISPDGLPAGGRAVVLQVGVGMGQGSLRFGGVRASVLP